jgi:uncharacterized protein YdaU (DUF1376 family)
MSFAFLPLYTGDYLRDTQHLSCSEHGIFLKLLMHCWDQRGPAPLDERKLSGIVNARSTDEIEAMRRVLGEFFIRMDDGHYNKRMAEEVAKAEGLSQVFREAGLKSANVRRAKARAGYAAKAEAKLNLGSTLVQPTLNQGAAKAEGRSEPPPPPPPLQPNTGIPSTLPRAPARPVVEAAPTATRHDCPHKQILELWAEVLPALPQHTPSLWKGARAEHLRARWRETADEKAWTSTDDGLAYFRKLFGFVGKSAFLTGRVKPRDDKPAFVCELAWLVMPQNWAKVLEGKYHQTEAA